MTRALCEVRAQEELERESRWSQELADHDTKMELANKAGAQQWREAVERARRDLQASAVTRRGTKFDFFVMSPACFLPSYVHLCCYYLQCSMRSCMDFSIAVLDKVLAYSRF